MSEAWELCAQHGGLGKRRNCTECDLFPDKCPNTDCDWTGRIKDRVTMYHKQACQNTCEYVYQVCPACAWVLDSYTKHSAKCSTTKRRK